MTLVNIIINVEEKTGSSLVGRASDWGSEGRPFKSGLPDQSRHFSNSEAIGCSLAPPEFIPYGDAGAGLASQKALYFGIKS